jgi:methionyl-tRNA formyltransferase
MTTVLKNKPRIVFMGTPEFAAEILEDLCRKGIDIVGVVTAADKPAGRGKQLNQSAVKKKALALNLPVSQPVNLKEEQFVSSLKSLSADFFVVVAFRMLPEVVWSIPRLGTFNLHASLLPQYRGAAPIQWALMNREKQTGVTTFLIDQQIDTGAILEQIKVDIPQGCTGGLLHDLLLEAGKKLVAQTIDQYSQGNILPKKQPDTASTEAPKLNKENTRLDWQWPGEKIDAWVRALNPYPVAWTELIQNDLVSTAKIYAGKYVSAPSDLLPGTLVIEKKTMKVALKDGWFVIDQIQLPGKKPMTAAALLNGFSPSSDAYLH